MVKPTLSDVAKAAGVSYATADRVVNARGNVAEKSIRKVYDAVASLGYVRDIGAANLSRRRVYRLAFVVPAGTNAFFERMHVALRDLAGHLFVERVELRIIEVAAFSVDEIERALDGLSPDTLDGLALVGMAAPGVQTRLQRLRAAGVTVVGLVSDLPADQRDAYVGIDNLSAGRTAARLLGMAHGHRSGCVQTVAGSLDATDHQRRLEGFRAVMEADFPHLEVLEPVIARDDADAVATGLTRALSRWDDITAVYNVGAGNSGLVRALRGRDGLLCVVHELVAHTRAALEDGLIQFVIDQRPEIEATRAVALLRALIDGRPPPPVPDLVPMIYVRDNLPTDQTSKASDD